jgi:RNA polymerase sigma-70 factor (ECF subfamily)
LEHELEVSDPAPQTGAPQGAPREPKAQRNSALAQLYEAHWGELIRYVRRTFGIGPPDPEDVVQAAFTHFAALAQPQLVDNPRAFLYRAARNFVIDQRRRALVRVRAAARGDLGGFAEQTDELTAERVLDGKDRLRILDETVRAMPQRLRDALILHRLEDLSYVEIARRLGVSQTSAKRLVADALLVCTRALRAANRED